MPTSTDTDGVEGELRRVSRMLAPDLVDVTRQWEEDTRASAEAFWSRSAVEIDDPLLENVWYETLYVKRCAFRAGVIAPGLALPSTVQDYSLWHRDYHTNYNYQIYRTPANGLINSYPTKANNGGIIYDPKREHAESA